VLATAEVVRDLDWSGRGLAYNERTERSTYLAARGCWAGLPPYPIWLTWFGAEYLPLVASYLRRTRSRCTAMHCSTGAATRPLTVISCSLRWRQTVARRSAAYPAGLA